MAHQPDLTDLNSFVDRLLREQRPDRYSSDDWIKPVIDAIPDDLIPEDGIRFFALQQFVKRREAQATRKANSLLRSLGESGQLVLDWWEQANDPIAFTTEQVDDSGKKIQFKMRVALRAATPTDFRSWSMTERGRAETDHKARLVACDGAEFVADSMERSGVMRFEQWARNQPVCDSNS